MFTLVVFHAVRDYDVWKQTFDEHEDVRTSHGEVEHRVYRQVKSPNTVIVHNDFATEEAATAFMGDPSLPAAMERGGVIGEPWLGLNDYVEHRRYSDRPTAVIAAVHHKVRDYEVWKPVFDEHEAVRRSHGATGHRIFRAVADPLRIVIHNHLPSVEAAEAFAADPSLPDAMRRGGVDGEPSVSLVTLAEQKAYAPV